MNSTERDLAKRAATAARIMLEYEAWEMPAPPPADPLDYAWTAQVITDQAAALASIRAERDAAVELLGKVSRSLTGLTPGGSEYHSHSKVLDTYYADTDACERVIRERFDGGHKAKLKLAEARAERDAAVAALKPFAEAAENLDDHAKDSEHLWESAAAMSLSAGDLRAARAIAGEQTNDA